MTLEMKKKIKIIIITQGKLFFNVNRIASARARLNLNLKFYLNYKRTVSSYLNKNNNNPFNNI